jgi:hypothetical protein
MHTLQPVGEKYVPFARFIHLGDSQDYWGIYIIKIMLPRDPPILTPARVHKTSKYDDLAWRKDSRERHRLGGLKPVLLVILGVRRRFNHVEGIGESGIGTRVAFRFVKDRAMNKN